ncbi:hypothetical protein GCM10009868_33020 [Terrabacter aerolatus]|uniref:Uncharacterized protein n=1 Tax=Terrabacter aerolatus TaxID=422442 RepID=A0A512CYK1_9MICO|nr:hypothetical protein [Terrabacter aerolatus]GEO29254.1 hypothetical protein TAE01_10640 [Terrabacter aerolatus]
MTTAPIAALGLVGGYVAARESGVRPLGGIVLGAAGLYAGRTWVVKAGGAGAAGLAAVYLGGFGASHVLAKKIGAWPSVLVVAAVSATASWVVADRR